MSGASLPKATTLTAFLTKNYFKFHFLAAKINEICRGITGKGKRNKIK
jgi:hypothetical protein